MERHFHQDLVSLQDRLGEMAGRVETALTKAMESLKRRDTSLAREVLDEDMAIDRIELDIERQCLDFLGLQQPVARDLRFIVAAIRVSNYLERIGDHAVNIAQSALKVAGLSQTDRLEDVASMAERTITMLRDSVSSWLHHDVPLARRVCERDVEIDTLKAQIFAKFSSLMVHDPKAIPRALELVLASRNLERVADLATNIAEEAIFVTEARVIKHHADERPIDSR
ncbi:MAG TPA: phosphate signaling complex protein PhoU [Candidatus Limnocylindrales bacterium]|nr:phosphate signaling complex protein PhoU [Candidatus Limnocylindrales bacterium]